ncbi:MAG: DMT family transporter [Rhodocyclaceae bacterium]|nr:DMT family transporter [Rhodocyclaceae bacterium]
MDTLHNVASRKSVPVICLLTGATVWGLVWYPYRILEAQGMSGIEASILTYLIALVSAFCLWRKHLIGARLTPMLFAVGLAAGACNLGYVVATLLGEVTRVLLLFYLSPLWTVIFARIFLGERLSMNGGLIILVSLSGACVMLWHPEVGMPWPKSIAEWLGLMAGIFFSLSNVLIKKTSHLSIELKSMAVFTGVLFWSLLVWPFFPDYQWQLPATSWLMLVIVGLTLVATNAIVQYAISHTRAAQAIVVMLFELVVAAIASWLLAGETLGVREWIGGTLIICASLLSTRLQFGH